MSQHTPGPLTIRPIEIRGAAKFEIRAGVQTGYQRVALVDFEPDARLIAQAPAMLHIVEQAARMDHHASCEVVTGEDVFSCLACDARAILREIEGK